jgi:hypothetical protein
MARYYCLLVLLPLQSFSASATPRTDLVVAAKTVTRTSVALSVAIDQMDCQKDHQTRVKGTNLFLLKRDFLGKRTTQLFGKDHRNGPQIDRERTTVNTHPQSTPLGHGSNSESLNLKIPVLGLKSSLQRVTLLMLSSSVVKHATAGYQSPG